MLKGKTNPKFPLNTPGIPNSEVYFCVWSLQPTLPELWLERCRSLLTTEVKNELMGWLNQAIRPSPGTNKTCSENHYLEKWSTKHLMRQLLRKRSIISKATLALISEKVTSPKSALVRLHLRAAAHPNPCQLASVRLVVEFWRVTCGWSITQWGLMVGPPEKVSWTWHTW